MKPKEKKTIRLGSYSVFSLGLSPRRPPTINFWQGSEVGAID